MRITLLALLTLALQTVTTAQTILIQEDFSSGIPAGWQIIDADGFTPHTSVSMFTDGWIWYTNSPDTTLATTSYFQDTIANAEDYVILPKQSLQTHSKLSWEARSVDASYPDGYLVLLSTTDSNITSFTDTLMQVDAEHYLWERMSLMLDTMGFANQDVFIAFCHNTSDGFILELDDIMLEVSDFTGLEEDSSEEIYVFPNPTTDYFTVVADNYVSTRLYDMSGRLVLSSVQKSIDISTVSSGKYYVIIETNAGAVTKGLIKR
ncbi:MAG: T9SS type A sorting domain-containing protein [Crocinitomicaceae bacterium]|nr:T9SS type A sorting domain-containing protein [Crocinitomicaceae bacterium]